MIAKFLLPLALVGALSLPALAEEEPAELETLVVSAPEAEPAQGVARPAAVLAGEALAAKVGNTIGDTLKDEPGIANQSFGPGVGRPVIRGQAGPRVSVMSNGLGAGDVSQLSPDHANADEPVLAERVEVLRGPSTLLYGSGAIGGIVNVLDNRIPGKLPEKPLSAQFEQRYRSAADESTSNLKLEGGQGVAAYHLDGFYRDSGNVHIGGPAIDENAARASDPALAGSPLRNAYGAIPNTNARAEGGTAGVSAVGRPGFAGVSVNYLENHYGVPPDGTVGGGNVRIDQRRTRYDFKSELAEPLAFLDALRLAAGYIDYTHTELDDGRPATVFYNRSYEGRLEAAHKPLGPFKGVVGFQGRSGDLQAYDVSAGFTDPILQRSQISSYGLFAVESFSAGPGTYELGWRGEKSYIDPQQSALNRSYTPVSASASGRWTLNDRNSLSLAVTRSQRAPQIQELYYHGVHDATRSYEIGDPNLKMETSYNLDLGYRYQASWATAELDLFQNWVNDYIYQQTADAVYNQDARQLQAVCADPGACLAVRNTRQADASFKGYELKLKFPLLESHAGLLDLTLFSDYTRGEFVQGGDVPRMPPLRYGFQLDYAHGEHWSSHLRLTRGEKQDHPGDGDTPTNGYVLLNLGVQYQAQAFKEVGLLVFARGTNLLNDNLRNAVSYLRNFAPEPGRGAELGLRMSY